MRFRYPPPHPRSSVSQQLLAIVQQRAMTGLMDSSLKFALTALWNLTDEMPSAARNFIECRGLELYQEVLEVTNATQKSTDANPSPRFLVFAVLLW